jgi:hypothetical protein
MLPNVTLAENMAGGIHPVESMTGCEIPLLSTKEKGLGGVRSHDEHKAKPTSDSQYQRSRHA